MNDYTKFWAFVTTVSMVLCGMLITTIMLNNIKETETEEIEDIIYGTKTSKEIVKGHIDELRLIILYLEGIEGYEKETLELKCTLHILETLYTMYGG